MCVNFIITIAVDFVMYVLIDYNLMSHSQIKAVKTGTIFWGTLTALSYFYMVSTVNILLSVCYIKTELSNIVLSANTHISYNEK